MQLCNELQNFQLLGRADAWRNVELPLVYRDVPRAERRRRAAAMLERVGLGHRKSHRSHELSGGQRPRVAIARALVAEPSLLLADEPTGNLDSATQQEILALFHELHRAGHTIVIVTHEQSLAAGCPREVRAKLSDVDDAAVRTGMAAECILDAYPQVRFKGTVQMVSLMARFTGRDAARRFFDVLVAFDGAASSVMRPGMSVRVEVIRRHVGSALLVPRAALRGGPGKSQVRRLDGGLLPVAVDFCSELLCAVGDGLVEGTVLAPAGAPGKGS